jgi:hypothetical protein
MHSWRKRFRITDGQEAVARYEDATAPTRSLRARETHMASSGRAEQGQSSTHVQPFRLLPNDLRAKVTRIRAGQRVAIHPWAQLRALLRLSGRSRQSLSQRVLHGKRKLERMRRANTRHGIYFEEHRRLMQAVRKLVREARQAAEET